MKIVAFTVADEANRPLAMKMINSFRKFHPDITVHIYDEKQVGDKINYYRATPMFARELIKDHDLVLKLDADQIITGDLTYLFEAEYDVGGVHNFSRADVQKFGPVGVWDINPMEYWNCGLVAMKSKAFIEHWWELCNSRRFNTYQYKEQDLLNILVYYGQYKTLCFDDNPPGYSAWHGLLSKGEWHRMELRDGKLILPKAEDKYPEKDKEIKIMHWAGGGQEPKMNYQIYCNEEVSAYLTDLIS